MSGRKTEEILDEIAGELSAEAMRLMIEKGWPNRRIGIRYKTDGTIEVIDLDEDVPEITHERE